MQRAPDPDIVERARVDGGVVVTFDLDFGDILALGILPIPATLATCAEAGAASLARLCYSGPGLVRALIRSWFGDNTEAPAREQAALRALVDALDRLEPERARHLAQFAYLLGRVAHADQHVSPEETRAMEALLQQAGGLPPDQAMLVVSLARTSNLMFGGTDNFLIARDFAAHAGYPERLALVRCLFSISVAEGRISIAEEREIQRIARELTIEPADLLTLRLEFRSHLPGLSGRDEA